MKRILVLLSAVMFIAAACAVPPGQIKKQTAPGQMKKAAGEVPASGKHK